MGIPAKFSVMLTRAGVALPAAMFAIVVVGLLTTSSFVLVDVNRTATSNREDASRAMHLAEQAVAHVLAIERNALPDTTYTRFLRGADGIKNTADDGYLIGYGLESILNVLGVATDTRIPVAGRVVPGVGTYYARLLDDPDDADGDPLTDTNMRIRAECRGVTVNGAEATINVILRSAMLPGLAVDGDLLISATTQILGKCGTVYVNQNLSLGDNITVTGHVATGDNLDLSGKTITHQDGTDAPRLNNQEPVEVPDLNPMDYCGGADYVLRSDGYAVRASDNTVHDARSSGKFGWKRSGTSPVMWETDGTPAAGTFCVQGNVKFSVSVGTAIAPLAMSIIASGSVQMSGSSYLTANHPDDILILSGGDVQLNGSSSMISPDMSGAIYARSQCNISGKLFIDGQLVCKNMPNAPGTENWVDSNTISGETRLVYGCGGFLGQRGRIVAWYPAIGN